MIHSKIVNKADFDTSDYRTMCEALHEKFIYHRKPWEFVMIANALKERGYLQAKKTGLGFGVGTEPLTDYFISQGCTILATDQAGTTQNSNNWKNSNQIALDKIALHSRKISTDEQFTDRCTFLNVDMNEIPVDIIERQGHFDFLWSSCALEHLGTLQNGLWFIMRSLSLLKPGGTALHTTEYNLSSNDSTNFAHVNCIYRLKDIQMLKATIDGLGHHMETLDTTRGIHEYDTYVDGAGWQPYQQEPHLNLKVDGYDATSALLIIRKHD